MVQQHKNAIITNNFHIPSNWINVGKNCCTKNAIIKHNDVVIVDKIDFTLCGYNSPINVHGTGPMPHVKLTIYNIKLNNGSQEIDVVLKL